MSGILTSCFCQFAFKGRPASNPLLFERHHLVVVHEGAELLLLRRMTEGTQIGLTIRNFRPAGNPPPKKKKSPLKKIVFGFRRSDNGRWVKVGAIMVEGYVPCHPERSKVPTLNKRAQTVAARVDPETPARGRPGVICPWQCTIVSCFPLPFVDCTCGDPPNVRKWYL